jgi:hypothetical protein
VQAVLSIQPEFDLLRVDAVALPIGRTGYFSWMFVSELADLGFQVLTTAERAALLGDSCTHLAQARAAAKVRVYVGGLEFVDRALYPYLAAECFPVETKRCPGI